MTAAYPGAIKNFTDTAAGQKILSAHVNVGYEEIKAVETELGTDPAGSMTDVKTRLAVSIANDGDLTLAGVSTLTISSGSITATGNRHLVDTQGGAASDDLDTISGGSAGMVLVLRIVDDARNVVIKHNTGNLYCAGGTDVLLDHTNQLALLVYDAALSRWLIISEKPSRKSVALPSATYAALATDDVIIGAGTFTITLPTSVASGHEYRIGCRSGVITVDGAGTDTVKGELTQVLYPGEDLIICDTEAGKWE